MASFGEKLRRAREARNLSLQEIAGSTKVSTRALQALEEERFEVLPGGIFNKGFVRAYARCVGLDEEKAIAEYLAAANPQPVELDTQAMAEQVTAHPKRHSGGLSAVTVVGVVAVLVAAVLAGLWMREQRREASEQEAQRHRAEMAQIPAESQPAAMPPAVPSTPAPDTSAATPAAAPGATSTAAPAAPSESPSQKVAPPAKPAESAAVTPASTTAAVTHAAADAQGQAPVEISIAAKERAWISVRSDGKPVETVTLDPDKPELRLRSYKAQERLLLIIGNPAGVTVTYNGKPAGVLGEEGSRAMITFTPEGIEKR